MLTRSLPWLLCVLAAGCSNGSSRTATTGTTAAPSTSGTGTVAPPTSGSTGTTPVTTATLPPNFQPVAFETLDVGNNSPRGVAQGAHDLHIGTDADWVFFWPSHSQAALPVVDFTQESVVGTFLGQVAGVTPFTRVIGVARDLNSDDLHALVRELHRGPWRPVVRVATSPFHLVRCASAVSGQGALTVDRQAQLDFETLAAGSNSALGTNDPAYTGGLRVLRDNATYSAFVALIHPGLRPPPVDFSTSMVVAVLGPYIPRFGNSVETLRLLHDPKTDEIRVISRVNPYRGGAAPPPATETPFQLLRVSRSTGTIRAERTTAVTQTPLVSAVSTSYRGTAQNLLIRDAAAFAAIWREIGGAAPTVDFAVDQVLVAIQDAGSNLTTRVARTVLLEDDELSVRVETTLSFVLPIQGGSYDMVTIPRTLGPVTFETVDVTPRP